jgi:hypothetical protein
VSDTKAEAAPTAAPAVEETAEQAQIEISRAEIAQQLAGQQLTTLQKAQMARGLGLTLGEITALASGRSDLRMTPAQYADLKAKLTAQYAKTMADGKAADGKGLCGSSGTPATPAAKTVPPNTSIHDNRKITVEGTKAHEANVDGGVVTLRTGAQEDVDLHPDNFTIAYKGPDAQNHHWLQFIHREIIGIHADNSAHPQTGNVTTSGTRGGAGYKLTTGGTAAKPGTPTAENYNTDTTSSTDPFYEAGFASNRTADSSTIIDLPGTLTPKISAAFAAGAKKVVSRAMFDTYLIHTDKVTYHMQVTVEWTHNAAADDPRPVMTTSGSGAASDLPPDIRTTFHAQYPAFNFIK